MKVLNFEDYCNYSLWLCCDGKELSFRVVHRKTLDESDLFDFVGREKDSILLITKSWLDENKSDIDIKFFNDTKNRIYEELEKENLLPNCMKVIGF